MAAGNEAKRSDRISLLVLFFTWRKTDVQQRSIMNRIKMAKPLAMQYPVTALRSVPGCQVTL